MHTSTLTTPIITLAASGHKVNALSPFLIGVGICIVGVAIVILIRGRRK